MTAVDAWGFHPGLAHAADRLLDLPCGRVVVEGADRIPAGGPALLVVNRGPALAGPLGGLLAAARGLEAATGRRPRFVGIVDVDPLGALLRRLGGALDHPGEVASLLRAGHLVLVPVVVARSRRLAPGRPDPARIVPAAEVGAPVLAVAVRAAPVPVRWRVRVGRARVDNAGRGRAAAAWLAEGAGRDLGRLLRAR